MQNRGNHIFISHASIALHFAQALCERLENVGFSCWIAPRNVQLGAHYATELSLALSTSAALLVLLDEKANTSSHVLREATSAVEYSKPIFVIQCGDFTLSHGLSYLFSGIQRIHVSKLNDCISPEFVIQPLIGQLMTTIPWLRQLDACDQDSQDTPSLLEVPPDKWDYSSKLPLPLWFQKLLQED